MKTGQVGKKNISHLLLRMKTYTERRRMKKKAEGTRDKKREYERLRDHKR